MLLKATSNDEKPTQGYDLQEITSRFLQMNEHFFVFFCNYYAMVYLVFVVTVTWGSVRVNSEGWQVKKRNGNIQHLFLNYEEN